LSFSQEDKRQIGRISFKKICEMKKAETPAVKNAKKRKGKIKG
jgi:hypothetical protein